MISVWTILGIVSIILLIIYWGGFGPKFGPSAVWGGLTLGLIIGFIVAIFYLFKGNGFNWFIVIKGVMLGVMLGFIAELLGMVSDSVKRDKP